MDLQALWGQAKTLLASIQPIAPVAAPKPTTAPPPAAVPSRIPRVSPPPAPSPEPENRYIDDMIAGVVKREGGYNDVAGDAGGATNDGISLRYLKGVGIVKGDLDHDGDIDKDDIRLVTPAVAASFYKHDFFYEPRIDRLPSGLQEQVFDIAVNSGPPRAITLLQKALRGILGTFVVADGVIGPKTRACCDQAIAKVGLRGVTNAVVEQRVAWYKAVVAENPVDQKFLAGWLNRANSFRVP